MYDVYQDRLLPIDVLKQNNQTELTLSFAPFQSFFVLISEEAAEISEWSVTKTVPVEGNWTVQLDEVAHQPIKQKLPDFWTTSTVDDVRSDSRSGTYRLAFNQPPKLPEERVMLQLERVES